MKYLNETLFSKNIVLKTRDIYPLSLDILDNMSAFGNIIEKRHEFVTDGPTKSVNLFFDVEDRVDDHSSIIFSFMISGETNGTGFLDVGVKGSFSITLPQRKTIASGIFNMFYFINMVPTLRKLMERKLVYMDKFIEKKIARLNFKYVQ